MSGKVRRCYQLMFGDSNLKLEVVDDYVYLSTTFNYKSKFDKAIKISKPSYSLLTKAFVLDMFDKISFAILLYG